jgi:nitrogen fixation NifU-like protein
METDFDRSVEELERQVVARARTVYSAQVVDAFYNPCNVGRMSDPDARGLVHGWCGDTMAIYLRIKDEKILEANFMADGCGPTVACGSVLTTMIQGMSLAQAGEIRPKDLLAALGGLPEENVHCAELAVCTLQNALVNWRVRLVNHQRNHSSDHLVG